MSRPLEGIRVIEMGLAVAGPLAGQILGDMGADVIKVEAPFSRPIRPSEFVHAETGDTPDPWNRVSKFNELNRSKRSLTLDLSHAKGKEILLSLVEVSDIVLENFSSRVLGNLGLGYEALKARNPGIILVSMPGFGKDGPYASRVAYGPGIDAMSGLAHMSGYVGGGPLKPGNHYCDQNAGVFAALGAMAALRHRRLTGEGQQVELAMFEGGIQTIGEALVAASVGVPVQARQGNRNESMAPHGVFKCEGENNWVAIAVRDDDEWLRLCGVGEFAALAADERLRTVEGRLLNQDHIEAAISAWCASQRPKDVEARLQAVQVSAGAVLRPSQMLSDPHLKHRGSHPFVDHQSVGKSPVPAVAWHFGLGPSPPTKPAPLFGGDNAEILAGLLGYSGQAIEALRESATIVDSPTSGA